MPLRKVFASWLRIVRDWVDHSLAFGVVQGWIGTFNGIVHSGGVHWGRYWWSYGVDALLSSSLLIEQNATVINNRRKLLEIMVQAVKRDE